VDEDLGEGLGDDRGDLAVLVEGRSPACCEGGNLIGDVLETLRRLLRDASSFCTTMSDMLLYIMYMKWLACLELLYLNYENSELADDILQVSKVQV